MKLKLLVIFFFFSQSVYASVFTGPGTHYMEIGDSIEYNGYKLVLRGVGPTTPTARFSLEKEFGASVYKNFNLWMSMEKATSKFSSQPYMAFMGINIRLVKHDHPTIAVKVYEKCEQLYEWCTSEQNPNNFCAHTCSYNDLSTLVYKEELDAQKKPVVQIQLPPRYEKVGKLLVLNAKNCLDKTVELTGLPSKAPIFYSYGEVKEDEYVSCHYGNFQHRVMCGINSKFNDKNIKKFFNYEFYKAQIEQGKCIGPGNTPFQSTAHEQAHLYSHFNTLTLDHLWAEGFASYVASYANGINPPYLQCYQDYFTKYSNPNPQYPYYMSGGAYNTGYCLIEKLVDLRGLQLVVQYAKDKFCYGKVNAPFGLFDDFINPALQPNWKSKNPLIQKSLYWEFSNFYQYAPAEPTKNVYCMP